MPLGVRVDDNWSTAKVCLRAAWVCELFPGSWCVGHGVQRLGVRLAYILLYIYVGIELLCLHGCSLVLAKLLSDGARMHARRSFCKCIGARRISRDSSEMLGCLTSLGAPLSSSPGWIVATCFPCVVRAWLLVCTFYLCPPCSSRHTKPYWPRGLLLRFQRFCHYVQHRTLSNKILAHLYQQLGLHTLPKHCFQTDLIAV